MYNTDVEITHLDEPIHNGPFSATYREELEGALTLISKNIGYLRMKLTSFQNNPSLEETLKIIELIRHEVDNLERYYTKNI